MGENSGIEFNFEELEFIEGGIEALNDDSNENKENTGAGNQNPAEDKGEAGEASKPETIKEKAAQAAKNNKEDTVEGETPERVDGSATGEKGDGEESSPQLYHTLANVLKEQGVFSSVDDSSLKDINDVETLIGAIKSQIQAEEFTDLTEQQKIVLNDMRAGVKPTTASKFKTAMDQLESITPDTIENNKQARFDLIYQDFIAKGFEVEKAQRYANRSFELNEDKQDALEAKDSLKRAVVTQYDAAKQVELDAETKVKGEIAKSKSDLKDRILKSPEVMEGVEISEGLRHEIFDEMNNMVSTNPKNGVPENALMKYQRENPLEFSHKLYYLYKVTNGFNDLGYFGRQKTTNSVKQLETALRQSTHVSGGGDPSYVDDGNSHTLDIGEIVSPFD